MADWNGVIRISLRLGCAAALGALVGFERESKNRPAGLRTHMMVALGSAVFALLPFEVGVPETSDLVHLVEGIAPGIGFLGAGAILKLAAEKDIVGLTTASSIWLTAAVGLAVGAGAFAIAVVATLLSLLILAVIRRWER
jgi:putative Mg2+ transporter-C (MgtC) family protein